MTMPIDDLSALGSDEKRQMLAKLLVLQAGEGRTFPLSFGQERLWLIDRINPGTPAYNVPRFHRLRGPLDAGALERSIGEIIRRHGALRTNFGLGDGLPVQIVHRHGGFRLTQIDLSTLVPTAREAALLELARNEAGYRFVLAAEPLIRATLVRLAGDEHALLLTLHHIVVDGWSLGIFFRELGTLYDAFTNGRPSPLADLELQYSDVAVWQRRAAMERRFGPQLAYWKQQLADVHGILEWPADRPRLALTNFPGATFDTTISRAATDALERLARSAGATLYMVLLACLQIVLARYTGQTDIVIGSPIAGRNRPEIEDLIGPFINTLALRGDIAGDPRFDELLDRVRMITVDAFDHADVPFERVVEVVRPTRIAGVNPLVQAMLVLQNTPPALLRIGNVRVEPMTVGNGSTKFDLLVSLTAGPDGLAVHCEYDTEILDAEKVGLLLDDYRHALAAVVEDPTRCISTLPLEFASRRRDRPAQPAARVAAVLPNARADLERSPEFAAIAALWRRTLSIDQLRADDDFFLLGGHSLLAARMLGDLERELGYRFSLADFVVDPTPAQLIGANRARPDAAAAGPLRMLERGRDRTPFIFLHGDMNFGGAFCRELVTRLGPEQPFYTLAPHGAEGGPVPDSIEAMAADYVAALRRAIPRGPYRLGGFCNGALVAFEMARQLHADDAVVDRLVLINAVASPRRLPLLNGLIRACGRQHWLGPRLRETWSYRIARLSNLSGLAGRKRQPSTVEPAGRVPSAAYLAVLGPTLTYHPEPYDGAVTLILSDKEPVEHPNDPTAGWGAVATGVDVMSVAGDHLSLLHQDLPELGDRLADILG